MQVSIWADGAVHRNGKPDARIGCGAVFLPQGREPRLVSWGRDLPGGTNIRAELEAISLSLEYLAPSRRGAIALTLYTDSEWSIRSLSGVYRSTAHAELRQRIKEQMAEFGSCSLEYVRGHAGNEWNEAADELASAAAGTLKKFKYLLNATWETIEMDDERAALRSFSECKNC